MRRFELKNKEHQKVLEELIPDFSSQLETNFYGEWGPQRHVPQRVVIGPFSVSPDDVEEVETYDPKGWNMYPEVTPPPCVLMRVEGVHEGQIFHRAALYSESGSWFEETGTYKLKIPVQRFRPWDDKEKCNE